MADETKTYYVTLPLVGSINLVVEAATEGKAIKKAQNADWGLLVKSDGDLGATLGEFETPEQVCEGNILYAPCHEASAEEEE